MRERRERRQDREKETADRKDEGWPNTLVLWISLIYLTVKVKNGVCVTKSVCLGSFD